MSVPLNDKGINVEIIDDKDYRECLRDKSKRL